MVSRDEADRTTPPDAEVLLARVRVIQQELAALLVLDKRTPDKIIGYNERGHFD